MSKPMSKFAHSLKQLGEIQVNDWDFMALMNKDIKDVEIAKSLRKLGSLQVMEWDFRSVLPAVSKLANQEVDVAGFLRRTANYKVMEWDFRKPFHADPTSLPHDLSDRAKPSLHEAEIQALIARLKDFLQYVVGSLIDEPGHLQIRSEEIGPDALRFKLILTQRDASMLIGTGGHTAAAIRRIVKLLAATRGIHVLVQIQSHQEEIAEQQAARKKHGRL